jgi:threonylcarbamoyladenosine tRNA methylthiotransferase MtaB
MLRVAFRTLGCKLNQLESESLADAFRRSGAEVVPFDEGADLFIVNTCTVTSKAEQKARRAIRSALSSRPGSVVIVTGCYAQMDPQAIVALDERAVVVPGDEKDFVLDLAAWLAERWQGHGDLLDAVIEWRMGMVDTARPGGCRESDRFAFKPEAFVFHSRPAMKIQDGCDNRCSYCRVCLARGPSLSLGADEALARVRALEAAGRAEVVLTGVNISQFRDGDRGFPELLAALLAGTTRMAFRISSFEPERIDDRFLEVFAHPRVRPHAHLPVQSGSDSVLARMARAYRRDKVLGSIDALRRVKGDLFLAADFIAGFPGETDADFADTLDLAQRCGFSWIHAFPFSPRPGTKAFGMRPMVPEREAGERVDALNDLARRGRAAYLGRQIGSTVEAVLEGHEALEDEPGSAPREAGARFGTSSNYLKLWIEGVPPALGNGDPVLCRIEASLRGPEASSALIAVADARAGFVGTLA